MADSSIVKSSKEALDTCAKEYLYRTGDAEGMDAVTHVYVDVSSEGPFVMAFLVEKETEKENFTNLFSCGLHSVDPVEFFFMGAPSFDPIIDSINFDQIYRDLYDGKVEEVIFLRDGPTFKHVDTRFSQLDSEDGMN